MEYFSNGVWGDFVQNGNHQDSGTLKIDGVGEKCSKYGPSWSDLSSVRPAYPAQPSPSPPFMHAASLQIQCSPGRHVSRALHTVQSCTFPAVGPRYYGPCVCSCHSREPSTYSLTTGFKHIITDGPLAPRPGGVLLLELLLASSNSQHTPQVQLCTVCSQRGGAQGEQTCFSVLFATCQHFAWSLASWFSHTCGLVMPQWGHIVAVESCARGKKPALCVTWWLLTGGSVSPAHMAGCCGYCRTTEVLLRRDWQKGRGAVPVRSCWMTLQER